MNSRHLLVLLLVLATPSLSAQTREHRVLVREPMPTARQQLAMVHGLIRDARHINDPNESVKATLGAMAQLFVVHRRWPDDHAARVEAYVLEAREFNRINAPQNAIEALGRALTVAATDAQRVELLSARIQTARQMNLSAQMDSDAEELEHLIMSAAYDDVGTSAKLDALTALEKALDGSERLQSIRRRLVGDRGLPAAARLAAALRLAEDSTGADREKELNLVDTLLVSEASNLSEENLQFLRSESRRLRNP